MQLSIECFRSVKVPDCEELATTTCQILAGTISEKKHLHQSVKPECLQNANTSHTHLCICIRQKKSVFSYDDPGGCFFFFPQSSVLFDWMTKIEFADPRTALLKRKFFKKQKKKKKPERFLRVFLFPLTYKSVSTWSTLSTSPHLCLRRTDLGSFVCLFIFFICVRLRRRVYNHQTSGTKPLHGGHFTSDTLNKHFHLLVFLCFFTSCDVSLFHLSFLVLNSNWELDHLEHGTCTFAFFIGHDIKHDPPPGSPALTLPS